MICPVCGYPALSEHIFNERGIGEICPCCYFEFGIDEFNGISYLSHRKLWIDEGLPFINQEEMKLEWNYNVLIEQLKNLKYFNFDQTPSKIQAINADWTNEIDIGFITKKFNER